MSKFEFQWKLVTEHRSPFEYSYFHIGSQFDSASLHDVSERVSDVSMEIAVFPIDWVLLMPFKESSGG